MNEAINIPCETGKVKIAILKLFRPLINNPTDTEITIIASMLNSNTLLLNRENRHELRGLLNMDKYTFNNYIKSLKDKKILYTEGTNLKLNPSLSKLTSNKEFKINFHERSA